MEPTRPPTRQVVIADPRTADLLLDEDERRFLALFLDAPRTVSQVAAGLGEERRRVLYRVRKLLRHGLLRIARLQPRAGRPIKHYQASAESFVVPYAASRAASSAEFVAQLEGTLRDAFYESFLPVGESDRFGLQVGPGTDGEHPSLGIVIRQDGGWRLARDLDIDPVNTILLSVLRLPATEAEALRDELEALLARYSAREEAGAPPFLLRLGLVRLRR